MGSFFNPFLAINRRNLPYHKSTVHLMFFDMVFMHDDNNVICDDDDIMHAFFVEQPMHWVPKYHAHLYLLGDS